MCTVISDFTSCHRYYEFVRVLFGHNFSNGICERCHIGQCESAMRIGYFFFQSKNIELVFALEFVGLLRCHNEYYFKADGRTIRYL